MNDVVSIDPMYLEGENAVVVAVALHHGHYYCDEHYSDRPLF